MDNGKLQSKGLIPLMTPLMYAVKQHEYLEKQGKQLYVQ